MSDEEYSAQHGTEPAGEVALLKAMHTLSGIALDDATIL